MHRVLLLAALIAAIGLAPAQAQQCPVGSFPSVDRWGNQVCKRFGDHSTATAKVQRGQQCPNGAYPTVDDFGNQICRSFNGPKQPRTDYYDTSKGCPTGSFPTLDNYGNNVCRRF